MEEHKYWELQDIAADYKDTSRILEMLSFIGVAFSESSSAIRMARQEAEKVAGVEVVETAGAVHYNSSMFAIYSPNFGEWGHDVEERAAVCDYFENTIAHFLMVDEEELPKRFPDHVSLDRDGELSSFYWVEDGDVFRVSSHWSAVYNSLDNAMVDGVGVEVDKCGMVATCIWLLDAAKLPVPRWAVGRCALKNFVKKTDDWGADENLLRIKQPLKQQ